MCRENACMKSDDVINIEITHLKKMPKPLSPYACAAKTLERHHTSAKRYHNAYPFEMPKSISPYACAAKTLARKTEMVSSIGTTYSVKMQKSLSPYACAAKSLFSANANAKRLIGANQKCL